MMTQGTRDTDLTEVLSNGRKQFKPEHYLLLLLILKD